MAAPVAGGHAAIAEAARRGNVAGTDAAAATHVDNVRAANRQMAAASVMA